MIQDVQAYVEQVCVRSVNPRDPVEVREHPENWRCIGVGNTAAVFRPKERPHTVVKVYADTHAHIALQEAANYVQLGDSPYFPRFFGRGDNFLVIEYKRGINLYDCLLQGVLIPERVIQDVDEAIRYARSRGLNPSDIHVKNVLLHNGRGHLVDVSEYGQAGECRRWETLKKAYYNYYLELYKPGRAVPSWLLETIRKWYKANEGESDIFGFAERIKRMFF